MDKAKPVLRETFMPAANYSVKTFGCKVNTYDSALIQKNLNETAGFFSSETGAEVKVNSRWHNRVQIINTCAVTNEAVKEAQRWIRKYRRDNPRDRIVVTGCAAQVETERFSEMEEVDLVVANSHKAELAEIVAKAFGAKTSKEDNRYASLLARSARQGGEDSKENAVLKASNSRLNRESDGTDEINSFHGHNEQRQKVFKSSIFKKSCIGSDGGLESGHTRLFLKIQDGCDSFCTFCIIPFARGKSRSLTPTDLIRSVQKHYEQGVREVVLTGVHIGDYQFPDDNKKGLVELVRMLLQRTQIPRIRLSSLEPPELSEELLELFTDSRMCPHFHLSIQSAHSEVLKRMKRNYTAAAVEESFIKINKKAPNAFVGMDLIAGFAEETQKQFEDTYTRLKNWPWTRIHVFPYSPRRYTYAERAYSSWPRSLIMKRAGLLRNLSENRFKEERRKQIGTIKKTLPLKHKNHISVSRDYWTVLLPGKTGSSTESFFEKNKNSFIFKKSASCNSENTTRLSAGVYNKEILVHINSVDEQTGYLVSSEKILP